MISILVTIRNARSLAATCLMSLGTAGQALFGPSEVEFILIDDASEQQWKIPELLAGFRRSMSGYPVTLLRFRERQHYTAGLALGISVARGESVLFVSHDMAVTQAYIRTAMQVGALDATIGLVRGTSRFVDCFPQHEIVPPVKLETLAHMEAFAEFVSQVHGLRHVEDEFLTGDAFLLKRSVIDKIGVLDTRYFGYFGDVDYGLRIQKAGFRMVCAKGAWLHHEGAGFYKNESQIGKRDNDEVFGERVRLVREQYGRFHAKWTPGQPPTDQIAQFDWKGLRERGPADGVIHHAPLRIDPALVEVIA